MKKGVIYFTWDKKVDEIFKRSIQSVRETNPDLSICWITNIEDKDNEDLFDLILPIKSNKKFGWHRRTESLLDTPFEITLQLDTDTIIRGDLSYGFDKAEIFGMSICHAPACHSVFIKSTSNNSLTPLNEDQPVYNAGVIFYKLNKDIIKLIHKWIEYNDKCITGQDQGGLSNACESVNFNPFVLTKNWNFRHFYKVSFGPIKIWHSSEKFRGDEPKGFFRI